MKTALAVFGGFVLSLALFLSGAVVAVLFLTGKPARQPQLDVNQSEIWTKQPRAVDRAAQQFERLPARPAPSDLNASREPETPAMANEAEKERSPEPLDRMATFNSTAARAGAADGVDSARRSCRMVCKTLSQLSSVRQQLQIFQWRTADLQLTLHGCGVGAVGGSLA